MPAYVRTNQVIEMSNSTNYSNPFFKTSPNWQDTFTSQETQNGVILVPDDSSATIDLSKMTSPVLALQNTGSYTVRVTFRTDSLGATNITMDLLTGQDVKLTDVTAGTAITLDCQTASQTSTIRWAAWSEA